MHLSTTFVIINAEITNNILVFLREWFLSVSLCLFICLLPESFLLVSGFAIPLVNCSEAGHKSGLANKPTLVMNSRNERKDTTYFDPVINLLLEITFWNMGIDDLPYQCRDKNYVRVKDRKWIPVKCWCSS